MVLDRRLAGVLLHPTSLPGRFGIGDLGPECYRFLDWMREAGLAYWQILPLGPTGYGDSPYQCFSAFAGNPMLVSPELLVQDGLVRFEEIVPPPFPVDRVEYGPLIEWKVDMLRTVFQRYQKNKPQSLTLKFAAFKKRSDVRYWLDDYALFRVCKDIHKGVSWLEWKPKFRTRDKETMKKVAQDHAQGIEYHKFCQFLFFDQWERVREAAGERDITIVGDAPIYVALDSSDTWSHQEIFQLDKKGQPKMVAGVPPDYFSETGQLWGNPLYDWDYLEENNFRWWVQRMRGLMAKVDLVRLDHFRAFAGYWAVPFTEETAVNGRWIEGPGDKFFKVLKRRLGDLPIIAEDLGEITADVYELRDQFDLPGMKVLQFAWGCASTDPIIPDPEAFFTPHQYPRNCVVYTGTHDNDTTVGWWNNSSQPEERTHMQVYLATDGAAPHWDFMRTAFRSVANTAIVPMQDFLGLGTEARMNFPGKAAGNWTWRLRPNQMSWDLAQEIRIQLLLYQRCSNPPEQAKHKEHKAIKYHKK